MTPDTPSPTDPLATLYELGRRARHADSAAELGFLLTNDTHALAPYRQAVLWLANQGLHTHSGVVTPDTNAPYGQWVERVCSWLGQAGKTGATRKTQITSTDLPPELAQEWAEWWPTHALWLALPAEGAQPNAGLVLVRDEPWTEQDETLLREWSDAWWHAFQALYRPSAWSLKTWWQGLIAQLQPTPEKPWWKQSRIRWVAALVLVIVFPVRLSVLAPGELVPANPVVLRAPLDGVVEVFHVNPNQVVKKDQPLFGFDEALIQSRLDVAEQNLATVETEYRQTTQQALLDAKVRAQLALLTGRIEEKRTEAEFLRGQLQRARVLAPQDGVALFDDPSEWLGKPVTVGERIMRISDPSDTEVEVWLPLADAIALVPGDAVTLYLNASPLSPVSAKVRYMAHDAVQRPDGNFAYRVRAQLESTTQHRVGLKGTAKVQGGWVPLVYWVMRRPLASLRVALGI